MWTSILLAALAGGAAYFVWGMISWMVLPWNHSIYTSFRDDDAFGKTIEAVAPTSGFYMFPSPGCDDKSMSPEARKAAQEAKIEKMKKGPVVIAVVNRKGFTGMGGPLLRGLLTGVVLSGLLAFLLTKTSIHAPWKRAAFVAIAAWAGFASARLADWNWYGYPTRMIVIGLLDALVGWSIAGLVVGLVLPG